MQQPFCWCYTFPAHTQLPKYDRLLILWSQIKVTAMQPFSELQIRQWQFGVLLLWLMSLGDIPKSYFKRLCLLLPLPCYNIWYQKWSQARSTEVQGSLRLVILWPSLKTPMSSWTLENGDWHFYCPLWQKSYSSLQCWNKIPIEDEFLTDWGSAIIDYHGKNKNIIIIRLLLSVLENINIKRQGSGQSQLRSLLWLPFFLSMIMWVPGLTQICLIFYVRSRSLFGKERGTISSLWYS